MSMSERMHVSEPVRRIEVFTGAGRRRRWPAEDKAAIVAESYAPGETVCAVARRHGLAPQQLFTWRRLARRTGTLFVPAVIEAPAPEPLPSRAPARPDAGFGIELEVAGVVIRVGHTTSEAALIAVIRAVRAST